MADAAGLQLGGFELLGSAIEDRRARFEIGVPASCPYFEGHFPGNPLLPAVAQLALAEQLAARAFGGGKTLIGIANIRFRLPVGPEDHLEVQLELAAQEGVLQLAIHRAGARVCSGELLFGDEGTSANETARNSTRTSSSPTATAGEYLQHRAPALFVEELLEQDELGSLCRARVPPESPFVRASCFPTYLALELGAQSAAAAEAIARRIGEPGSAPRAGFLVGARAARFARASLLQREEYLVRTRLLRAAPPLRTWRVEVMLASESVATAAVSTFAAGAE
jgi:3-hydroxyacyl-[acyl-carrier-protein] dehydratase